MVLLRVLTTRRRTQKVIALKSRVDFDSFDLVSQSLLCRDSAVFDRYPQRSSNLKTRRNIEIVWYVLCVLVVTTTRPTRQQLIAITA